MIFLFHYSGHGLSGMGLLSWLSFIAVPCMFGGGIVTAFAMQATGALDTYVTSIGEISWMPEQNKHQKNTSQTLNESISGENLINWRNRWFSAIRDPGKRLFNMTSSVFINSIIMNCNSKLANGIFTQFSSELGQHDFLGENLIYTYVYVYAEHPRVLFFFLAEVSFHFLSGYMLRWSLPNYFYQGVFNQIIIDITCMLWYYAMALYNPYVL